MKILPTAGALFLALLLGAPPRVRAETAPSHPPELAIIVVESLERGPGRITDFDRIKVIFTQVIGQRHWPLTVEVERFAANPAPHDLELTIFYRGIYPEDFGDQTFHAWLVLNDHGKKSDFGIIRFRYYPRAAEREDDTLEHVVRGAAEITADKIGPILFPKDAPKN
jgi:hypothetical protein